MCITKKKSARKEAKNLLSKEEKPLVVVPPQPKPVAPPPPPPEKKPSKTGMLSKKEKNALANALAQLETQISTERTVRGTDKNEEVSPEDWEDPKISWRVDKNNKKSKDKNKKTIESEEDLEDWEEGEEKDKKSAKKEKRESKEKHEMKPVAAVPKKKGSKKSTPPGGGANPSRSPNRAKKAGKTKWSQQNQNPDDLSINNDKTEFLENAQLTKLMSHADVKALMGGPLAQGQDAEEMSGRDTVEEVDSQMQDIAFSPLLADIKREEEKPFGVLPNPQEAKKPE